MPYIESWTRSRWLGPYRRSFASWVFDLIFQSATVPESVSSVIATDSGESESRPRMNRSDVPGCRQVVVNGVNGFLCEAKDAESLGGAMRRLAQLGTAEIQAMAGESRRKVVAEYSETVVIRAYLDALEKVAALRS